MTRKIHEFLMTCDSFCDSPLRSTYVLRPKWIANSDLIYDVERLLATTTDLRWNDTEGVTIIADV